MTLRLGNRGAADRSRTTARGDRIRRITVERCGPARHAGADRRWRGGRGRLHPYRTATAIEHAAVNGVHTGALQPDRQPHQDPHHARGGAATPQDPAPRGRAHGPWHRPSGPDARRPVRGIRAQAAGPADGRSSALGHVGQCGAPAAARSGPCEPGRDRRPDPCGGRSRGRHHLPSASGRAHCAGHAGWAGRQGQAPTPPQAQASRAASRASACNRSNRSKRRACQSAVSGSGT